MGVGVGVGVGVGEGLGDGDGLGDGLGEGVGVGVGDGCGGHGLAGTHIGPPPGNDPLGPTVKLRIDSPVVSVVILLT